MSKLDMKQINYPPSEDALLGEIYIDDVQSGHETTDGALKFRNDDIGALKSVGMELRKWSANYTALLSHIPATQ